MHLCWGDYRFGSPLCSLAVRVRPSAADPVAAALKLVEKRPISVNLLRRLKYAGARFS
jgi:hypothetical protein